MPLRILLLGIACLFLASCWEEQEIRDGQLPDAALPVVNGYLGNYTITINDRSTEVSLALEGHKLVLTPKRDLLRDECNSLVGDLLRVAVETVNGKKEVRRASFQFSPGKCADKIVGKELEFDFEPNQPIKAAILQRMEIADRCDYWHPPTNLPTNPVNERSDRKPPSYGCHAETIPFYLRGVVVRIP